jgi:hypothetical protein
MFLRRRRTLINRKRSLCYLVHRPNSIFKSGLRDQFKDHAHVVKRSSTNETVRLVLGAALEDYQTWCRFDAIKVGRWDHARRGFYELARDLAGEDRALVRRGRMF